jgi:hypothetical protein
MREWLLYVGIMAIIFVLFFRERGIFGAAVGLLVAGPLYLGLGAVLAKLGYQRKTIKELRAERSQPATRSTTASSSAPRPRPAPTKRTSGGTRPKRK